jgi:hypothetical protein
MLNATVKLSLDDPVELNSSGITVDSSVVGCVVESLPEFRLFSSTTQ